MTHSAPRVEVAVPLPIFKTFTYRVAGAAGGVPEPGCRVLVPFGGRHLIGLCVGVHSGSDEKEWKPIRAILDCRPLLSERLLKLAEWLAGYYLAPPGEVLRVMLPPGLLLKTASPDAAPERFWPVRRRQAVVGLQAPQGVLTERQQEIYALLQLQTLPVLVQDFIRSTGCSPAVLSTLARKRVIEVRDIDVYRSPFSQPVPAPLTRHPLSPEQESIVVEASRLLARKEFDSLLIHGITGSGKTEIYLNIIGRALEQGRTALMMVPEIGLTPQISRQFRSWFGSQVAILHSGLPDGERFDQWRRIRTGEAAVVVGTRSSVFAPLQNLAVIIVDEEHDGSYKQEDLPRYHGRDTALKRGQLEGALVVLGSATPQLETYHRAVETGRPRFARLASRVLERALPQVHIVDMRSEFEKHGKGTMISDLLKDLIRNRLEKKEQILVLLNRRGYAAAVLCRSCGRTETCINCSISLTFHQQFNRLSCHYCGYSRSVPRRCRECGKEYIFFVGEGTEQVEEMLRDFYPQAEVARLDRDSVQRRGSYERILGAFASGKTQILVGTQMIAKGHDFPRVTLVGVLGADQGLRLADFRAAERTFQLLTQVAGRAGRGEEPGEVVIQTWFPNHYSLKYACAQDFERFYQQEIRFRRNFGYPPFAALAHLVVNGPEAGRVRSLADRLVERLNHHRNRVPEAGRIRILGPAPAPLERIKNDFRYQVLIKTSHRPAMREVISRALADLGKEKAALKKISVDVDPVSLM